MYWLIDLFQKKVPSLIILSFLALVFFCIPGLAHSQCSESYSPGYHSVTFGNGNFVAVGKCGVLLTSNDGNAWTTIPTNTTKYLYRIVFGRDMFVAVGSGWNGTIFDNALILTSPDGILWTERASGTANILYGVAYGNNTFVAVGQNGTILTSTDGNLWTKVNSGTTAWLYGVTFGGSTFVAVGDFGVILTSMDGANWTPRSSLPAETIPDWLYEVCYGNGTFVAVGDYGKIVTSSDGGNAWTKRTSGSTADLYDVIYGDNKFVSVGQSGTILTSSDGTTWAPQVPDADKPFCGITYGKNTYILVGQEEALFPTDLAATDEMAEISLAAGWNFISFPLLSSNPAPIESVLQDVLTDIRIVWGYDNILKTWRKYPVADSQSPYALNTIEFGKGYWIYMNTAGKINISGWSLPSPPEISLTKGWNLVGYLGARRALLSAGLTSIGDKLNIIWRWENGEWSLKYRTLNTTSFPFFTVMNRGKAYWIQVTEAITWGQ
jgi:photosystem II stability/assembly factor-like uncharacterized protein